jgi:hypothetical protein
VAIEFNPTIPFDTEYVNKPGRNLGNSALSIKRYAESMDYSLIAMTQTNLIFLDKPLVKRANLKVKELDGNGNFPRYFFGYDGTLISLNQRSDTDEPEAFNVPWQKYRMLQPIPRPLRVYGGSRALGVFQILASLGKMALTRPGAFFSELAYFWHRPSRNRER